MAGNDPLTQPLVSVVIPTYDRPALLEEAVDSVREQTYPHIELIVVDDLSPTPAAETLDAHTDSSARMRIVRHETNQGANAARNTGIKAANGEFVAFLDDDDRWLPEKVERQVARFHQSSDVVGVVYTGAESINADGEVIYVFEPRMRGDVTKAFFRDGMVGSFSRVMVRSSVIEEAGFLDERFPSWQDREWYLRLSRCCQFEYVREPLVVHTWPGDQISDDFERMRDVSYPLLLEKHRSMAAEYGPIVERQFVASLSRTLGAAGLRNGYYRDAVRYFLTSVRHYPLWWKTYAYLLLAFGGRFTYRSVKRLKRGYHRLASGG